MRTNESVQISVRSYLSIQLIQSAALFSKLAAGVEANFDRSNKGALLSEHRSYVTGTIFTAVAFLEANINEIFKDCHDDFDHKNIMGLGPEAIKMYGQIWGLKLSGNASFSILDKYQIALTLAKKDLFDRGALPYQDAENLIRLRNALMHYKPESVSTVSHEDSSANREQQMEKWLKGKFPLNPLTGAGSPYFPHKCLSYGCSAWAVKSCLTLTDTFYTRLSLTPTYEHVREKL